MKDYLSPLQMAYQWERVKPDDIFLSQPIDGVCREWTWHQAMNEVRRMATYLRSLNLNKDSKIAILSKNCAHWIMSDLAIMMSGHISVPLYPNLNSETLNKILVHSESKILFVGKLDEFENMKPGIPDNISCITYPFYSQDYPKWDDIITDIDPFKEEFLPDKMKLATIIYTSGTTGDPKGVMHKFYNFGFATTNAVQSLNLKNETFFSYLPLSHIAERLLVEMGAIYTGGKISFAETIDTFSQDLSEASPTVFLGVPRIWAKFQEGILSKIPQKKLNLLLNIPIVSSLIKKKIKKSLGLGKARNIFTGAAPTPPELIIWFSKLDVIIQEAYAMTENTCYSHVSYKENIKVGSVGQALPHCKVKLSDINEIMIQHDALMDGYYKNQLETDHTIKNGWLHTGDEGSIDSDGFLKITGRVKDIFKTSKGKYIAPSPIEMILSSNEYIEQVCVVGLNLPQPIAIVVLSSTKKHKNRSEISSVLLRTLELTNKELDSHERLHNIVIVRDIWSVENKLLTPTMKIKRNLIEKRYKDSYLEWYDGDKIIFA